MPRGGARNRSGPVPSETSLRSDRRGYVLTALPAEGYSGPVPEFPLTEASDRELEVWAQLWRTPQACAWTLKAERWRVRSVALYCRWSVRAEDPDAPVSVMAQVHRLGDQIGMTTAGLAEMGWKVAADELTDRAAAKPSTTTARPRRMRAVGDG